MQFFIGLHQPGDAKHFTHACISYRRLNKYRKSIGNTRVILDSGAFTEILSHGDYRAGVEEYAEEIKRIFYNNIVNLEIVVSQDYMCEDIILKRTGLTIKDHQRLTIERYDKLKSTVWEVPILPVLQGFDPEDYVEHLVQYGDRLQVGHYVGVGSVCKRNRKPEEIRKVLYAIKKIRPDLRLHGFGIKKTSLKDRCIQAMLFSADSMAWSYWGRKNNRSPNSWITAKEWMSNLVVTVPYEIVANSGQSGIPLTG